MITNRGFTLVEVLVGLSIATIAAVSVAYTIASTNKVADAGKKTFIATNLAHQGLELTRALRDDAWFVSTIPKPIWIDGVRNGLGGISGPIPNTVFTRRVTVVEHNINIPMPNPVTNPEFIEVTSEVTWTSPQGALKSVSIKEKLYNWYGTP